MTETTVDAQPKLLPPSSSRIARARAYDCSLVVCDIDEKANPVNIKTTTAILFIFSLQ